MYSWLTSEFLLNNPNYIIIYDSGPGTSPPPPNLVNEALWTSQYFPIGTMKSIVPDLWEQDPCCVLTDNTQTGANGKIIIPPEEPGGSTTELSCRPWEYYFYNIAQYRSYFNSWITWFKTNLLNRFRLFGYDKRYIVLPMIYGRHNRFKIRQNIVWPTMSQFLNDYAFTWLDFWEGFDPNKVYSRSPIYRKCWSVCESDYTRYHTFIQEDELYRDGTKLLACRELMRREGEFTFSPECMIPYDTYPSTKFASEDCQYLSEMDCS